MASWVSPGYVYASMGVRRGGKIGIFLLEIWTRNFQSVLWTSICIKPEKDKQNVDVTPLKAFADAHVHNYLRWNKSAHYFFQ